MFLSEQKRSKCKGRKRAVVVFTQKCLSPKAGRRHMDTGQLLTSSSKKRWKGQGRQLRVARGNYAVRTKSRPHVMLYQTYNLSGHMTPKLQNVNRSLLLLLPKLAKQRRLYQSSSWRFAPSLVTLWDLGVGWRVIVNRFCECFNVLNFHIFITSPCCIGFDQFRLNVEIRTIIW